VSDWERLEQEFASRLSLSGRPVAVTFLDREPAGVQKFSGSEPSGCSFWRLAANGRVFYTIPADHFNCPVGSHTHNIPLPPERAGELNDTLKLMFDVGYITPAEVPQIPHLRKTPAAVVYAPLGDSPVQPDVVIFMCRPATAMLLNEAAQRAGASASIPPLGRPTCMGLPAAMQHGGAVTSLGCIGNRVYTGAGEDDLYLMIPGAKLAAVAEALVTIQSANSALTDYARGRRAQLSTE